MASYQDSEKVYLPQGSPAVDLNLYANTLDYKQQQYNAGVQRVQSTIDSIAGLDVARDMDKQYINGKLSEVGTKLNQLVGGDYGNQSLVNRAASLAPQIAKDDRVQNAVLSTQALRSTVSSGKALKKNHPELYPIQAQTYDNDKIGSYLNSSDPDASYRNTEATQYNSPHKPLMDFLSEKDPTVQQVRLPSGQFTYKTVETSKITEYELQNLINSFFTTNPQYQKAAEIDAHYNYRGLDANGLYNKSVVTMLEQSKMQEQKIATLDHNSKTHLGDTAYMEQWNKEYTSANEIKRGIDKNINDYKKLFSDGTPLDDIKVRLHMDNIRNGYASLYEEDNKKEEIKANEEAINRMKFQLQSADLGISQSKLDIEKIKVGIDPKTGRVMDPNNPNYPLFLAANPAYAKSMAAKLGDQSQYITVTQKNDPGNVNLYSDAGIDKKISEIKASLNESETDLRKAFAQTHFITGFDHDKGVFLLKSDEDSFKTWQAQQENYIQYPETKYEINKQTGEKELVHEVPQAYLDFRKRRTLKSMQIQNLNDIKDQVQKDANSKFSMNDINKNISINLDNGEKVEINIAETAKNSNFLNAVFSINRDMENIGYIPDEARYSPTSFGVSSSEARGPKSEENVFNQVVEKYKGTPEYSHLKRIRDSGKWLELTLKLDDELGENEKNKEDFKSKQYTAMASRINPQGVPINSEDFSEYRQYIAGALGNKSSDPQGIKDLEKVIPNIVYTGLDDKAHIQYTDKDGHYNDIPVPGLTNIIGKPNPDKELNDIIENSYSKSTPFTGINTLVSNNGKIKFAISKNPMDKTTYNLYILNGKGHIQIAPPSNKGNFQSAGEAQRKIEDLSTMLNPKTNKQYTFEEIINLSKKVNE